jgi:hypothetical protein
MNETVWDDDVAAAMRAAKAIMAAYDRGILEMGERYLADTLRMLLANLNSDPDSVAVAAKGGSGGSVTFTPGGGTGNR